MKTIKTSIFLTITILGLAVFCRAQAIGSAAPDFSAKDISGRNVTLSKLKGKVILLEFWATWCPPCRVEVPNLLEINRKFKNNKFVMISINLDRDLEAARKFVADKEMRWVHLINLETCQKIADLYQVEYLPSTFVIGSKGTIESSQLLGDELKNKIAALLK